MRLLPITTAPVFRDEEKEKKNAVCYWGLDPVSNACEASAVPNELRRSLAPNMLF